MDFDHVLGHLFKAEIQPSDEIKGPFERWNPISSNPLFTLALEKLKTKQKDRRESTITATLDLDKTTIQDLTITSEPTKIDDLTIAPIENKRINEKKIDKNPKKRKVKKKPLNQKRQTAV